MNGNQLISLFHAFSLLTTRRSSGEVKKRVRPRSGRLSPNFHRFYTPPPLPRSRRRASKLVDLHVGRQSSRTRLIVGRRVEQHRVKQRKRLFSLRTTHLLKSWLRMARSHFLVYVCVQTSPLWCIYWGNLAKACRKCKWWMQVQRKYSVVGRTWTAAACGKVMATERKLGTSFNIAWPGHQAEIWRLALTCCGA